MRRTTFAIVFALLSVVSFSNDKAKAKELFSQRDNKEKLLEAIAVMENSLSKEKDYETMVLLSRAYYFLAEYEEDKEKKLEIYDKGTKAGESALNTVEGFAKAKKKKKAEAEAVKTIGNENIDALYWTAANLARWAKFASFTQKLSVKARIRYLWDRVMELDPKYFYGGVYRFFGGYYALVPTITGENDPNKSKEMFEKCLEIAPDYLETKVLYAEAYCTHPKVKDKALFQKYLNEVIAADVNVNADLVPENKVAVEKAKKLLAQEKELFEE
jgi:hypothetical protein